MRSFWDKSMSWLFGSVSQRIEHISVECLAGLLACSEGRKSRGEKRSFPSASS